MKLMNLRISIQNPVFIAFFFFVVIFFISVIKKSYINQTQHIHEIKEKYSTLNKKKNIFNKNFLLPDQKEFDDTVNNNNRIFYLEKYSKTSLLDFVEIGLIKEIHFNATKFVDQSNEFLPSASENSYISNSGTLVALSNHLTSNKQYYLHCSVVNYVTNSIIYDKFDVLLLNRLTIPLTFMHLTILDSNFQELPSDFEYQGQFYPKTIGINHDIGSIGPEDTRAIVDSDGNIIITFNMDDNEEFRLIWYYDLTSGVIRKLSHPFHKGPQSWVPFINQNDEVNFIYSWDPVIRPLRCGAEHPAKCFDYLVPKKSFSRNLDGLKRFQEKITLENENRTPGLSEFRGGSSLVKYKDFYVTLIRIRTANKAKPHQDPVFKVRLAILDPNLNLIYLSENLDFKGKLFLKPFFQFEDLNQFKLSCSHASILKSSALTQTTANDWVGEFSVNDQKNFVVVFKDLTLFIDAIIERYMDGGREPDQFNLLKDAVAEDKNSIQWCSGKN
ncbi:hypothetical protein HDU92_008609 [Lobulomyces angularis]|nr:hypothetical protein HDU92_008609 [Lobulomyces angularis]